MGRKLGKYYKREKELKEKQDIITEGVTTRRKIILTKKEKIAHHEKTYLHNWKTEQMTKDIKCIWNERKKTIMYEI